ncbi:hypothetical protein KM1_042860 [Entamoeba histolytica HM-3:IMSS]|uniref:Uncharacterized protein n=5 Tax=Entamoeba histolytica TaxID=5759 RepID=C4LWC6_ENTH1|nr:hypothetical protein EHI_155770 [Entamoeba histolytica HM-1:IMSS]EAL50378.1 hypothetical protein EHI_155770 [Entamoeba histolytica HM-1:IMSS]EMS14478.1 hypothetical protein KM1_042860 [Entamoeba histolytica HM-3:IMSS]ENY64047.1 hypothetical protein EHI7A_017500 [Entamoeba histolytica HM-1:IMSS-A]GAT93009.1 hypothetical protein CL6EHI_155770 [Entamoeba histolytica]|eukprot:XP_655762.1 hypothetical protein EHI_155770 [Entamoeba histolytica HM-1:IMSS]
MELNSLRTDQKIKKEEFEKTNKQLQQLVSDNYSTLLGTSESVIQLSKISHFLSDQLNIVSIAMGKLKPIEEQKKVEVPKTLKEQFLEFLMVHETVSDYLQNEEYLRASITFNEIMKTKDILMTNKRYNSYLSKRMRVILSTEKDIIETIKTLFGCSLIEKEENKVIEAFVVYVKHTNQRLSDVLQDLLLQRRVSIISMLQDKTSNCLPDIYNYILDTYLFVRKYFTLDNEGKMQLLYNSTYKETNDYFLNFKDNIEDSLLQWKRLVQQEIGDGIISQFNSLENIESVKKIAIQLVNLKKERKEEDLIYDSIFFIPLNRRINVVVKELWKREFGVFQSRHTLPPNALKTKVNLNTLFFEPGIIKTQKELSNAFVDCKAVEVFVQSFEYCFEQIQKELDEIYNEDGTNKNPEIFTLEKKREEVFGEGFISWSENLNEELYQMNNEMEKNKTNPSIFKELLLEFLSYCCFIHQCCSKVLRESKSLQGNIYHSLIIIKETLTGLSYKAGQYFFDTILMNLRVPFLKDASMESYGFGIVKNIVWKKVDYNQGYYLTVSNPSYITERFYSRMHLVLSCLGTVSSPLILYVHSHITIVLLKRFEDYLRSYGNDFAPQFVCDLMIMRYSLLKTNEILCKELNDICLSLSLIEKSTTYLNNTLNKINEEIEDLKKYFDDIDFCLYFNDSKEIATEYYTTKCSLFPTLFPSQLKEH